MTIDDQMTLFELLAEAEHRRWMACKHLDGWMYTEGPKNNALKTNPCLVPYHELARHEKIIDRSTIRNISAQLQSLGLKLVKIAGTK